MLPYSSAPFDTRSNGAQPTTESDIQMATSSDDSRQSLHERRANGHAHKQQHAHNDDFSAKPITKDLSQGLTTSHFSCTETSKSTKALKQQQQRAQREVKAAVVQMETSQHINDDSTSPPSPSFQRLTISDTIQSIDMESFGQIQSQDSPTELRRNVTEEDDLMEHHESQHYYDTQQQQSPGTPQSREDSPTCSSSSLTPSSMEAEVARSLRHVQAREDCINPVSRILWSKTDEEDELMTTSFPKPSNSLNDLLDSTASSASPYPIADFRVVSPAVRFEKAASNSSSNSKNKALARPMPVRPMLFA